MENGKVTGLPTTCMPFDNQYISLNHYGYIPRPLGRYLSSVLESTVYAGHCKTKTSREACAA
jgi:hypothetical protein